MEIEFNASQRASLGVEWELMLVDRDSRDLANAASRVLDALGGASASAAPILGPSAKHELFENTIEVVTGVCSSVAEVRADLVSVVSELHAEAERQGLALACAGTHPFAEWVNQVVSPDPRYHELVELMQWPARRLLIFGVHVHVGVRSAERSIAITNALCGYLAHFLALAASSPLWRGYETGLASTRSKIFETLPTAGLPFQLSSWSEFERFMHTLISAHAIRSIREVWWDIRPHPHYGTVELRMCDGMPTLDEVLGVAAMAQCLVHRFDRILEAGEPLGQPAPWVVRENKWLSVRYGLDAAVIVGDDGERTTAREALARLVEELAPEAAELGCRDELAAVLRVLETGASYERQRAVTAAGGKPSDVVDLLVTELEESCGLRVPRPPARMPRRAPEVP